MNRFLNGNQRKIGKIQRIEAKALRYTNRSVHAVRNAYLNALSVVPIELQPPQKLWFECNFKWGCPLKVCTQPICNGHAISMEKCNRTQCSNATVSLPYSRVCVCGAELKRHHFSWMWKKSFSRSLRSLKMHLKMETLNSPSYLMSGIIESIFYYEFTTF